MSIELMARVWKIELSHSQQAVLLAMADFANDDGRNCYPSHKRLAWKTGYSERQISRLINELIEKGIVKVIKLGTNMQPPRYWIRLDKGIPKKPYESVDDDEDDGEVRDDKMSPQENRDDILSPQENRDDKMSPPNSGKDGVGDDKMSPLGMTNATVGDDTLSSDPSVNHQYKLPTKEEGEIAGATPAPSDTWPEFLEAFCWVCHGHKELSALTEKQKGILTSEAKRVRDGGYTLADLRTWFQGTWQKDYRWTKKNQHERPKPSDVRSMIPTIRDTEQPTNGSYHVDLPDADEFQPAIHPLTHMPYSPSPPLPRATDDPWAIVLAELARELPSGFLPTLEGSSIEAAGMVERENGTPVPLYRVLIAPMRAANGLNHFTKQAGVAIRRKLGTVLGHPVQVDIVAAEAEQEVQIGP